MTEFALRWTLTAFSLSAFLGPRAIAQASPSPCGVTGIGAMEYGGAPQINSPYTATVVTTHEQKLTDGNIIKGSVTTHQMRDSAGRTRSEIANGCVIDADGKTQSVTRVSVVDSAGKTLLSWEVNDRSPKIVRVFHSPPVALAPPQPRPASAPSGVRRVPSEFRTEKLGTKTIAGVVTEGSRSIRTIPPGEVGNERPIEVLDEIWIANGTRVAMLRINDDPRGGRTTTEVVEMLEGEPDAALFSAPAGYAVEDQVVKQVQSAASP